MGHSFFKIGSVWRFSRLMEKEGDPLEGLDIKKVNAWLICFETDTFRFEQVNAFYQC